MGLAQLPTSSDDILLVGDSVTAGVYFLSLSQESSEDGWGGQLLRQLDLPTESIRLDGFYPIDHLKLARDGLGLGGLRYPWEALRAFQPRRPRFAASEERAVLGLPGQLAAELLTQSSKNKGSGSAGWTFGALFLPEGLSAIETAEQWEKRPRWVCLFIGANDALASLGIVGRADSPSPAEFRASYRGLSRRLRSVMADGTRSTQLFVLTIPDVTKLPLLQPVPSGARDEYGETYPDGSMASAFLIPFRSGKFRRDEVWTPDELATLSTLVTNYNDAIRDVAREDGYTVVDLQALIAELGADPQFSSVRSPYFSPDLHHPSAMTQRYIAQRVLQTMADVANVPMPAWRTFESNLPTNADFDDEQLERVFGLTRLALLGLSSGPLPPKPTYRVSFEAGTRAGPERVGDLALSVLLGAETTPSLVTSRWLSRGSAEIRATLRTDEDTDSVLPRNGMEARAGVAFERIGAWSWLRLGAGGVIDGHGDAGWFTRLEWRPFYMESVAIGGEPDRFEIGIRWSARFGRIGAIGN